MSVHVTLRIFSGLPGSSLNEYAFNNRASEQKCESNMADSQTQKSNFTRSQVNYTTADLPLASVIMKLIVILSLFLVYCNCVLITWKWL